MKRGIMILLLILIVLSSCTLIQPESSENNAEEQNEIDETDEEIESRHWERIFAKAFSKVDCPKPPLQNFPAGYYKGKLFDTHIHMQSLPDGMPGLPDESYSGDNLGIKRSIDEWACMMDYGGTYRALVFFPVWDPITDKSIDVVKMAMEKYPGYFVPFVNPPGSGGSKLATVDAKELKSMLEYAPGLFRGYGEIGLYGHDDVDPLPPDSEIFTDIYPVLRENNLLAYFHMGFNQKDALERVARANRDINFIFHGGHLYIISENGTVDLSDIEDILYNNPNVYYGVDELYGGDWLLEPGRSKEKFLDNFKDYGPIMEKDISRWKGFIERHPDQIIWGTDRGVSASWDKDPEVAITFVNYTRAFIGKLDPSVQEKFAYKNAERLTQR